MPTSNNGLSVRTVNPSTLNRSSMSSRFARIEGMMNLLGISFVRSTHRRRLRAGLGRGLVFERRAHVLPESLRGIDAELLEIRLHVVEDGGELAEECTAAGGHLLDRAAPLAGGVGRVTGLAPYAHDEGTALV